MFVGVKGCTDFPGFGAFVSFLHFATKATYSRGSEIILLSDQSINQTINRMVSSRI